MPIAEADEATGSAFTAEESAQWLAFHNAARREVAVAPLAWSPELAKFAQAWADELARTGRFEHRPPDGDWAQRYGENLAVAFGPAAGLEPAFQRFMEEKAQYVPGTAIAAETFAATGHYTAIVWRATTHLGAGKAVITTGDYAGATVIVTNFNPPGNQLGSVPY